MKELTGNPDLLRPIEDLKFSPRVKSCLYYENIGFVGELVTRYDRELLVIPNFGDAALDEVKRRLAMLGLSTNMFRLNSQYPPHLLDAEIENNLREIFLIASDVLAPAHQLFTDSKMEQSELFSRQKRSRRKGQLSLEF